MTSHNRTLIDTPEEAAQLNRLLSGWANYFCLGPVSKAYRAIDAPGRQLDLALFNLAIDSRLRGCDVVAVRVDDVAPSGYAMDRATIWQRKTNRPVRFELSDQTRMAIDEYLRLTGRKAGQFLFAGRGNSDKGPDHAAVRAAGARVGSQHRA